MGQPQGFDLLMEVAIEVLAMMVDAHTEPVRHTTSADEVGLPC